jgi:hypothetical protein
MMRRIVWTNRQSGLNYGGFYLEPSGNVVPTEPSATMGKEVKLTTIWT